MNLTQLIKHAEKLAIDNSPAILTAFGIVGTVSTAYLTGKATVKAVRIVDEENEWFKERSSHPSVRLTKQEIVKLVWKNYIPPVASATFTIAAIFAASHVSSRRATAMATAYSISEKAFSEYKEKVIEKIGPKKEQSYRDELAQDRVTANPPNDKTVIITDNGDVLCYDHFTGRYFKSCMESLKKAENEVNHMILNDGYASLTDLYYELGLKGTSFSDEVGWTSDHLLEIKYSTVLSEDGRPCISIDFDLQPSRNFSHFAEG